MDYLYETIFSGQLLLFSAGEVLHETDQYQTDATINSGLHENEDGENESLEPGEAEISNFSDYRSAPYIPPQLSGITTR